MQHKTLRDSPFLWEFRRFDSIQRQQHNTHFIEIISSIHPLQNFCGLLVDIAGSNVGRSVLVGFSFSFSRASRLVESLNWYLLLLLVQQEDDFIVNP